MNLSDLLRRWRTLIHKDELDGNGDLTAGEIP